MCVIPSPASRRDGRSLFPLLYRQQSARDCFPALRRPAGSTQPSIPSFQSTAISGYCPTCYRGVPARFDGTSFPGETAPQFAHERRYCGAMSLTIHQPRGLNLPKPKPPIVPVTSENVRDWWALFVNRKAYTRQSATRTRKRDAITTTNQRIKDD